MCTSQRSQEWGQIWGWVTEGFSDKWNKSQGWLISAGMGVGGHAQDGRACWYSEEGKVTCGWKQPASSILASSSKCRLCVFEMLRTTDQDLWGQENGSLLHVFFLHTLPHVSTINPQRGVRRGLCDREMGTLIRNLGEILVRTLWGCLKTYFSEARLIFLRQDWFFYPLIGLWVQQEELGVTQHLRPG